MICEWHNCEHCIFEFGNYYCPYCFYVCLLNGELGYCITCNIFVNLVSELDNNNHHNHIFESYYDTKRLVCDKYIILKYYDIIFSLRTIVL